MKEKKRKHDDAHFPLSGHGRKSTKPKTPMPVMTLDNSCECGKFFKFQTHLCVGAVKEGKEWVWRKQK